MLLRVRLQSAPIVRQDAIKTRKSKMTAGFVQLGLLVLVRAIRIARFVLRASTAPQMEAPCAYHARKVTTRVLTDRVNAMSVVAAERDRH
jgi:hypothetical protein